MTKENPWGGVNLSLHLGQLYSLCTLRNLQCIFQPHSKNTTPRKIQLISVFQVRKTSEIFQEKTRNSHQQISFSKCVQPSSSISVQIRTVQIYISSINVVLLSLVFLPINAQCLLLNLSWKSSQSPLANEASLSHEE